MEQISINILPKGAKPVCHSSQFDEGRQIMFNLFNDATPYTLSGTETISVLVRKPDGAEVLDSVTNTSDSYVVWDVSADACELSGVCECELSIVENGTLLGSKNFTMKVEEDAYGGRNIEVRTASGRIATFSTNMVEAFKSLKSEINPVQDLHGYSKPWSGGGGKNKFNDTTGTHTINANTDTTITIGDVYLEANTTYTISCKQTPAPLTSFVRNTLSVVGGGTTTYNPAGNDYTIKPMVFTPTVSGTYSIKVWGHTLSANTTYSQFQVEVGSTATAYEPYSNICPISGFSALNVTRTGVNLWNEDWESGLISITTGANISGVGIRSKTFCKCDSGKTYFMACPNGSYLLWYDANQNYLSATSFTGNLAITVPNNAVWFKVRFDGSNTYANNISLNSVVTDTTYHAYNGQTATVNFGQTVYGGSLDVTNGKVTVNQTKAIFNGSENWVERERNSSLVVYQLDNAVASVYNENDQICNMFNFDAGAFRVQSNKPNTFVIGVSNRLFVLVNISDFPNVTAFKSALSNNNLEIVYNITPIEITTTPENLTAIVGQNNVYSDTGDTTVEYYIEV